MTMLRFTCRSSRGPRWAAIPPAVLAALLLAAPARAVIPQAEQTFMETAIPDLDSAAARAKEHAGSAMGALDGVRSLLELRARALGVLATKVPLTSPNGIESEDQYDAALVRHLAAIVRAGLLADPELPPAEDARTFATKLREPLPLGDSPVGFMIVQRASDAVNAADALAGDPRLSPENAARLALHLMQQPIDLYLSSHSDAVATWNSNEFRQSAVIARLRCPKDDGTYRITDQKNRRRQGGAITTVYFLECTVCSDALEVEFPLDYVTKLEQIRERQQLKTPPRPARPSEGLDP